MRLGGGAAKKKEAERPSTTSPTIPPSVDQATPSIFATPEPEPDPKILPVVSSPPSTGPAPHETILSESGDSIPVAAITSPMAVPEISATSPKDKSHKDKSPKDKSHGNESFEDKAEPVDVAPIDKDFDDIESLIQVGLMGDQQEEIIEPDFQLSVPTAEPIDSNPFVLENPLVEPMADLDDDVIDLSAEDIVVALNAGQFETTTLPAALSVPGPGHSNVGHFDNAPATPGVEYLHTQTGPSSAGRFGIQVTMPAQIRIEAVFAIIVSFLSILSGLWVAFESFRVVTAFMPANGIPAGRLMGQAGILTFLYGIRIVAGLSLSVGGSLLFVNEIIRMNGSNPMPWSAMTALIAGCSFLLVEFSVVCYALFHITAISAYGINAGSTPFLILLFLLLKSLVPIALIVFSALRIR